MAAQPVHTPITGQFTVSPGVPSYLSLVSYPRGHCGILRTMKVLGPTQNGVGSRSASSLPPIKHLRMTRPPHLCAVGKRTRFICIYGARCWFLHTCPLALREGLPEKLIPPKIWREGCSPDHTENTWGVQTLMPESLPQRF